MGKGHRAPDSGPLPPKAAQLLEKNLELRIGRELGLEAADSGYWRATLELAS